MRSMTTKYSIGFSRRRLNTLSHSGLFINDTNNTAREKLKTLPA